MDAIAIEAYDQNIVIELAHKIKSIDEANSLYFEENKESTLKIVDKVIIDYMWWNKHRTDQLIELINHKSDISYSNSSILQLFERFQISFRNENISKFKLFNNSFPFWEKFEFGFNLSNDLEIITNPILYQNGIGSLELYGDSNNMLHFSDKFISNIWEIKPKSVWI